MSDTAQRTPLNIQREGEVKPSGTFKSFAIPPPEAASESDLTPNLNIPQGGINPAIHWEERPVLLPPEEINHQASVPPAENSTAPLPAPVLPVAKTPEAIGPTVAVQAAHPSNSVRPEVVGQPPMRVPPRESLPEIFSANHDTAHFERTVATAATTSASELPAASPQMAPPVALPEGPYGTQQASYGQPAAHEGPAPIEPAGLYGAPPSTIPEAVPNNIGQFPTPEAAQVAPFPTPVSPEVPMSRVESSQQIAGSPLPAQPELAQFVPPPPSPLLENVTPLPVAPETSSSSDQIPADNSIGLNSANPAVQNLMSNSTGSRVRALVEEWTPGLKGAEPNSTNDWKAAQEIKNRAKAA